MFQKPSVIFRVFLLASVSLFVAGPAGTKEKAHPQVMKFSGIVLLGEDLRVFVVGTMGPPEFFKGLHSVDSPQGAAFLNDSGEVRVFPDRMTVTVRILGPVTANGRSLTGQKLDYDLMRGLKFKLQWKRGMKLRDVREFRLHRPSESSFMDLENSGRPVHGWTYELVLEDTQVPLTDHPVLSILSPENKLLARMSAYL